MDYGNQNCRNFFTNLLVGVVDRRLAPLRHWAVKPGYQPSKPRNELSCLCLRQQTDLVGGSAIDWDFLISVQKRLDFTRNDLSRGPPGCAFRECSCM
jgi:hypothetical protein